MKKTDWKEIDIDLDNATFIMLAKEAHKRNITFNELCNIKIKEALEKIAKEKKEKDENKKSKKVSR